MRAMVLTAGLGTRLRPLTLERAKPAIPLVGKPIIVRLIEKLAKEGVTEFRMNLHHLPASITAIFDGPAYFKKYKVSFSWEPTILGTAGGLKANETFFYDQTFLMVNGDIVFDFDLSKALEFHQSQRALATMILRPQDRPYEFYPVFIDDQGHLLHFKQSQPSDKEIRQAYVFTGIHILEPEIFNYIPAGVFCEINDHVYPTVINQGGRVFGFAVEGYWNDVGNPFRYLSAHRHLLNTNDSARNFRDEVDVIIEKGARVEYGVWAETGCVFKFGSCAADCIFWENVILEKDVSLRGCIVGSNVIVKESQENRIITRTGSYPIE